MNVRRLLAYEGGFEGSFGDSETISGPAARGLLHLHRDGAEPGHLPAGGMGRSPRRAPLAAPGDARTAPGVAGDERPGHLLRVRPAGKADAEPGAAAPRRDRARLDAARDR